VYAVEVVEVVGLTAERWDLVQLVMGILLFTAGVLITGRF